MTAGLICSHLLYIQQLDERARISRYSFPVISMVISIVLLVCGTAELVEKPYSHTDPSTAKSLAGRDEIIIIYPRNASNDCPVMNEYSLHIFQDASSIPDLCFVPP